MKYFAFWAIILLISCESGTKGKLKSDEIISNSNADTAIAIDTPVATPPDPWLVGSFVDDFGEESNDRYMATFCYGTFSNSATSDEYLNVKLLLTTKNAGLFLHEYSNSSPPQKFIGTGKIRLKNDQGTDITIYSYSEWNQQGGLSIRNNDFRRLRDFLLKSKGAVKAVVFDEYSSTYNFSFSCDSFEKHFNELKNPKPKG